MKARGLLSALAWIVATAFGCASAPPAARPPSGFHCETTHHDFKDARDWAKVFDNPSRDAWQKPQQVVAALHLEPNDVVVDLGVGTGYFTVRLARALPRGRVIAVDIEPKMLDWIRRRAARDGLGNISTVLGTADSPGVKGPIDVVLVVNTFHHIDHRTDYFRRVAPLLAPGGRVVIVDFRSGKLPVGPPDRFKIPPAEATEEMHAAGFSRCGSFDGLPYQYMLSFGLTC